MNLRIQNVSLSIKGRLIVNDVSITVKPGEVVGLMGPNGAGKTTTFNIAVGNIKPDKGEVLMNVNISFLIYWIIVFYFIFFQENEITNQSQRR